MDGDYPRIERPTEPGRYWYLPPFGAWEVLLIYHGSREKLFAAYHGVATSPFAAVDIMTGEWAGPIPPPSKKPEPPALTPLASRVPQRRRRIAKLRQRTRPIVAEGLEP